MEITENSTMLERKHFLMRQLDHKFITQEEYNKKIENMDKALALNVQKVLNQESAKLKDEVLQVKKITFSDGNMKRNIARILIKFLETDFNKEEIKGIMRQGYKIMRFSK